MKNDKIVLAEIILHIDATVT